MNNFRLSTYKEAVKPISKEEINKIFKAESTIENLLDGRVIDLKTKKLLPKLVSCVYEIYDENNCCYLANSLAEAASIIDLYPDTLSKYLDIKNLDHYNKDIFVKIKKFKIRRVRVFYSK